MIKFVHYIPVISPMLLFFLTVSGFSQSIDLGTAKILCFETDKRVLKSITVLQEEIEKRSNIRLPIIQEWPLGKDPVITVGLENQIGKLPENYQKMIAAMPTIDREGYKIIAMEESQTVMVMGHDARGVLYGVGKLLRKMEARPGRVSIPSNLKIATSPHHPIRGHQLGYRPKTNAYDAWSPARFEDYIRDLAIFGANSIEIVPPRTDDDFTSVHMSLPAIDMIGEQSKICDDYGLDVWMWYPNMGQDYSHPDSIKKELEERHEVFRAVVRLDALFVPGGDPGDLSPDQLFSWLEKVAGVLHRYHPQAKIWVSPQVFRPTQQWFDNFYRHINQKYPWLGGVVFGPWIKTPLADIRQIIHPDIPIRHYPDITHSLSCQYPVPDWDLAYATTLGRECINPRPIDQKTIHNTFDEFTGGSISYSEGTNDDVNKIIWSDQDWDPKTPVMESLRDYARYFIGPDYTESFAQGILSLERNFRGPLLANTGVVNTLHQWQEMEKNAPEKILSNFRFQMGLIRAYYDAYLYRRLTNETELEQQALDLLSGIHEKDVKKAISEAKTILLQTRENKVASGLRKRVFELADSLFRSIGAQLTIANHHAMQGRGNFVDNIDIPLNNAPWLLDRLTEIEKITNEQQCWREINKIIHRNNPGPAGFYDNFGSPQSLARIKSEFRWEEDPGNLKSPRISFGVGMLGKEWVHEVTAAGFEGQASPIAWMNQATTLYDQPLEIVYDHLDAGGSYTIRVAYTGRFRSRMKMVADEILVHDFIQTGIQPIYEFEVPAAAISDGKVIFKWTCGEGERGSQVAEIWLLKNRERQF